jgi:hypothetical protein
LADSSPESAIRNANAFEYFAENTPSLSMPSGGGTPIEPEPEQKASIISALLLLLLNR